MSEALSFKDGVKARKNHRCVLCGEIINAGDLYDLRAGATRDELWTMRMHPECHNRETLLAAKNDDEGFWMRNWYEDCSDPAFERPARAEVPAR